jgi:transposase-like protein
MSPQTQLCPKCGACGKDGWIVIHSQKEQRYRCKRCRATFSERLGTAYYGLKTQDAVFTQVVTLLAYGCPPQAIVMAYGLDRRTVRNWFHKASQHSQAVHQQTVGQTQWDLIHVQVDEIKVRIQGGILWVTLALMVSTRLWLGVATDRVRSKDMIVSCLRQVAACALCRPLLIAVDGLNIYQTAWEKAFRSRHALGKQGRLKWVVWRCITLTQVIKARGNQRGNIDLVVAQGCAQDADRLRARSGGGRQINSAFIERFNATARQRLACLTRRTRHSLKHQVALEGGVFLMGCVYNFCTPHRSLAQVLYLSPLRRRWFKRTPAMAAGLTDHCWTLTDLLKFKIRRSTA